MIGFIFRVTVLVFLFIGAVTVWKGVQSGNWLTGWFAVSSDRERAVHTLVLEEMSAMGKLELVKYHFKDVVEQEIVKQWFPNAKAVLIVQGEAIGCIDLSLILPGDIAAGGDTVVVQLPEPELCVFKIDHSRSKVYNTEYAFLEEGALIDRAFKQAEVKIKESALEMGILEQTKENARKILVPLLEKTSGKPVVVQFQMSARLEKLR